MLSFCLISCCLAPHVRSWGSNERKEVSNAWQPRNPRGTWKTWFEGFFLLSGSENSPNTRCANNTRNSLKPSVNYSDENEEVGREGGREEEAFPFLHTQDALGLHPGPRGLRDSPPGSISPTSGSAPPQPSGRRCCLHTEAHPRATHGVFSGYSYPTLRGVRGDERKPRKDRTFREQQDPPTSAPRLICGGDRDQGQAIHPWTAARSWEGYFEAPTPLILPHERLPDVAKENTGHSVQFEFQINNNFFFFSICPMQYLEHTYTK